MCLVERFASILTLYMEYIMSVEITETMWSRCVFFDSWGGAWIPCEPDRPDAKAFGPTGIARCVTRQVGAWPSYEFVELTIENFPPHLLSETVDGWLRVDLEHHSNQMIVVPDAQVGNCSSKNRIVLYSDGHWVVTGSCQP